MVYGYVRVSTAVQRQDRQERTIKAVYPDAVIVRDAASGRTLERTGWTRLRKLVQSGDTIVFDEVSRLARDADAGFTEYKSLYEAGVELVFLKERHIDTAVFRSAAAQSVPLTGTDADILLRAVNEYLLVLAEKQIRLAFDQAQAEVDFLRQRTKEGLASARLRGTVLGRPAGQPVEDSLTAKTAKAAILKHSATFGGTLSDAECQRVAGCSRNSFYKYKRELKQEHPEKLARSVAHQEGIERR